jgi:hypothetical protein
MVQHVKLFRKQFNHLIIHLLERIVVIDGQMHIIIVIDHNLKVIQDIHLIGRYILFKLYLIIFSNIFSSRHSKEYGKGTSSSLISIPSGTYLRY